MPDETATPVETLEPPTAPSAPAELPEGAPVESAAEPAETFETILERFEAEDFPHKTRFKEWVEEREAHGWTKALESFEPSVQQLQQQQSQINEQVGRGIQIWNTIAGRINKGLEDGTLDSDAMSKLFQSPEAWKTLQTLSEEAQRDARLRATAEGSWQAANYLAAEVLKHAAQPNLLATFQQRLAAAQAGRDLLLNSGTPEDPVSHSSRFVLIDSLGRVRSTFGQPGRNCSTSLPPSSRKPRFGAWPTASSTVSQGTVRRSASS